MATLLLDRGADADANNQLDGSKKVWHRNGNLFLIEGPMSMLKTTMAGPLLLCYFKYRRTGMATLLLDRGADLDAKNKTGPLFTMLLGMDEWQPYFLIEGPMSMLKTTKAGLLTMLLGEEA